MMECLVSALPIVLLFVLMLFIGMPGWKSAIVTLVVTMTLAVCASASGMLSPLVPDHPVPVVLLWAAGEGVLKAVFPILLIIIMAIFSYNILLESAQIDVIKRQLVSTTDDRGILVLLIVWGFGGLLEGMAGFGTAVAIPAAILLGLGFKPVFSAVVALLGNTVATGFGAVGVPVITLCREASSDGFVAQDVLRDVSCDIIIQLLPMFFFIPFAILMLTDRKAWMKNLILAIWVGGVSAVSQYAAVRFLGAETPAIIGSVAAIMALVIAARFRSRTALKDKMALPAIMKAWCVYICILLLILVSGPACPPVSGFLKSHCVSTFTIPVVGSTFSFGWLSNAALMIFAGSIIGGLIQGLSLKRELIVLARTVVGLRFTVITIISLIVIASVMNWSGMIVALASGIVTLTGSLYPVFAPLIGAIGTFVTGSDTSSNILFAKLQVAVADKLGMSASESNWLLASNTTGASGGKMLSPQSIAIATAACDIKGSDAEILKTAIPYAAVYILLSGLVVIAAI